MKVIILGGLQEPGHAAANACAGLLLNPEQAQVVAADPKEHALRAFDEGLRWIAPIGVTPRVAAEDFVVADTHDPRRFVGRDRHGLGQPRPGSASTTRTASTCSARSARTCPSASARTSARAMPCRGRWARSRWRRSSRSSDLRLDDSRSDHGQGLAIPRRRGPAGYVGTHEQPHGHRLPWPLHDRAARVPRLPRRRRSPSPRAIRDAPAYSGCDLRRVAARDHRSQPAADAAGARFRPHHPVPAASGMGHHVPGQDIATEWARLSNDSDSGGSASSSRATSPASASCRRRSTAASTR